MLKTRFAAALLTLGLCASTAAQAQAFAPDQCATRAEVRGVAAVTTGPLLRAIAERCSEKYAAVSPHLVAARPTLQTRFAAEVEPGWDAARGKLKALFRVSDREAPAAEARLRDSLPMWISAGVTGNTTREGCQAADLIAAAVLPLPDRSVVDLMAALVQAGMLNKKSPVRLCEARS